MRTFELLKSLSEAVGVSGQEDQVRTIVHSELSRYCDEVKIGKLGSVIARKVGRQNGESRHRAMLAAHIDEIGMMVTSLEKSFLRFGAIGGLDARVLPGQEVLVHGAKPLCGLIASRPPHVLSPEEREKPVPLTDLFIDVGLSEDVLKNNVSIGDVISFDRKLIRLAGDLAAGKSLDNRASVAAIILAAETLAALNHDWDIFFVATCQEEVGLFGAATSAFAINPDVAVAIDVGFGDMPEVPSSETMSMGKGPGLTTGPNIHPALYHKLVETAQAMEIPYQVIAEPGDTGTDAWAIQVAREGVPTGLVSIPLRYMHTTVETVSLHDIERAARVLAAFAASLGPNSLDDLEFEI